MDDIRQKFIISTEHTGRFIVKSKCTGIEYFVEAIGDPHVAWGDVDPATKKLTGKYGKKYKGSIEESESLISEDNGFKNIVTLEPGMSPLAYIDKLDKKRTCSSDGRATG